MKKLLLLFALLLSFSLTYAFQPDPEYIKLTETTNGKTCYYHPKSIQKKNGLVYVWMMKNEEGDLNGVPFSKCVFHQVINCKTYESDVTHGQLINQKGETIASSTYKFRDWTPIPPGSVADAMAKIVCKK